MIFSQPFSRPGIIAGLFLSMVFFSCRDKEDAGPSLEVSPSSLILNYDAGDLIEFTLTAHAGDNELRNIQIAQKPEGGITVILKDTTVYGSQSEFFYVYEVPSGVDRILLTFTVFDTDGKSSTQARDLYVESGEYLAETTGHELHSFYSFGSNNAFNLDLLGEMQLDADPDSVLVDLVELDQDTDDALSHNLTSYSGIRFVRNNSFNYAQASAGSAQNNYTSSTAQQLITNVQVNDILITEYDTIQHLYAVIKLTGIVDEPGVGLDKYVFNVKK